jgi:UDP:flavonoid glycosyltransferase YjiC (YdhE family)
MTNINIVISTIFQNSGGATRALEIAKVINLQHLQDFGAGVMVSSFNWKAATLQKKVALMIEHQHYKDKAQELKNYAEHLDTKGKIAATVWNMIQKLK